MRKNILILVILLVTLAGCTENAATSPEFLKTDFVTFTLEITDNNGVTVTEEMTAAVQKLGDILREHGIITETGFVTTVNGITADWSDNEAWWKLEIDGDMAMQGIDEITVKEGMTYAFIYTQG